MEKIAVIWPSTLRSRDRIANHQNLQIYENVSGGDSADIALTAEKAGARAIVCTAGTKKGVLDVTQLPVYVATANYLDLLESLVQVERDYGIRGGKIALLLHQDNHQNVSRLQPYLSNQVEKIVFHDVDAIPAAVEHIVRTQFDAIVSGPTGITYARQTDIPAYEILYSEESVLDAVYQMEIILALSDKERFQFQLMRSVLAAIPNAIIVTDGQGNVILCNKAFERLFGRYLGDMNGRSITDFIDLKIWDKIRQSNSTQAEILLDIRGTHYMSTWSPIYNGTRQIGFVGKLFSAQEIRNWESEYRMHESKGLVAHYKFDDIVGESEEIKRAKKIAAAYAGTLLTVLIEGETGTGKELFAQSIHNASGRRYGPFVAVNCAALPESLLESELMGYAEGAFTGARKGGKIGLLELANKGTIFLDEINQMPPSLQSKLLRVLQEKAIRPVGGSKLIPVDIRIIAAANEDMSAKVAERAFRPDLYYRLNTLTLKLPPLRERKGDIPLLIQQFLRESDAPDASVQELSKNREGYSWPGNVRELQSYVQCSAALIANGLEPNLCLDITALQVEDSGMPTASETNGQVCLPVGDLKDMERELIRQVLAFCTGNKSRAAKILGVSRNTIISNTRDRGNEC